MIYWNCYRLIQWEIFSPILSLDHFKRAVAEKHKSAGEWWECDAICCQAEGTAEAPGRLNPIDLWHQNKWHHGSISACAVERGSLDSVHTHPQTHSHTFHTGGMTKMDLQFTGHSQVRLAYWTTLESWWTEADKRGKKIGVWKNVLLRASVSGKALDFWTDWIAGSGIWESLSC